MIAVKRALVFAGMTVALCSTGVAAHATDGDIGEPVAVERVAWFMPDYPADGPEPTAETATWPQSLDVTGYGWCQVDIIDVSTPEKQARLDEIRADRTLNKGDDYGLVVSWTFELCGTPPVVETPPLPVETPVPPVDVPAPPAETPVTAPPAEITLAETPAAPVASPRLAETGASLWMLPYAASITAAGALLTVLHRRSRRKSA